MSVCLSVHPSICLRGITRLPPDQILTYLGFLLKLVSADRFWVKLAKKTPCRKTYFSLIGPDNGSVSVHKHATTPYNKTNYMH